MGIRLKQRAEFEDFQCGQPGTMSATTITSFIIPFACVLKGVLAGAGTAGTTGTSNTDIRKNGTSIFASGATAIQFATTVATPTYGAIAAANPPAFVKGDIVTIVNTVVHTTPIQNLSIAMNFSRPRGSKLPAAVELGSVGVDSE